MDWEKVRDVISNGDIIFYFAIKERLINEKDIKQFNVNTFAIEIEKAVENNLRGIVLNAVKNYDTCSIEDYNPTGLISSQVIESLKVSVYPSVKLFLESLDTAQATNKLVPSDISFLVYEFNKNEHKVLILRRYTNLQVLRKGFLAWNNNGKVEKIEPDGKFGVDVGIDILIDGEDIFIFQHTAFERIFDLDQAFKDAAEHVLGNKKIDDCIIGADKLRDDILNNGNFIKRVAKLIDKPNKLLFLDNPEKTKSAIDEFRLNIDISDEGKYYYVDKTQLGDFVNLMQDAYYKTVIGGEKGTDERR